MSVQKHQIKHNKGIAAFAVMAFVVLGVFVKSVLPAGFMPTVNADGFTEIVICSGMGEKTITVPSDENTDSPHEEDRQASEVCAYQILASGKILLNAPAFALAAPAMTTLPSAFASDRIVFAASNRSFTARGPPSA
jgi:hypothetical protein